MTRKEEIEIAIPKNKFGDFHSQVAYEFGFQHGAEWADKTMLDKVCEWIEDNIYDYLYINRDFNEADYKHELIEDLRNDAEGKRLF